MDSRESHWNFSNFLKLYIFCSKDFIFFTIKQKWKIKDKMNVGGFCVNRFFVTGRLLYKNEHTNSLLIHFHLHMGNSCSVLEPILTTMCLGN